MNVLNHWNPELYMSKRIDQLDLNWQFPTKEQWKNWQLASRQSFIRRLGALPQFSSQFHEQILEEAECDYGARQRINISTFSDIPMPIYVLSPYGAERRPVVIALHGHGFGSRDIVGLDPQGHPKRDSGYQKNFAIELCRRGFVVIAPEILGFGDRRFQADIDKGPGQSSCMRLSGTLLEIGETLMGHRANEVSRLIDYASTRYDMDGARVGVMGISGGGTVAVAAAVLDERLRAVVISGYANTFRDSILDRQHCMCNYVPGTYVETDMPEIIGLIAPRPLLIESGLEDTNYPIRGSREAAARLQRIYNAAQAPEALAIDQFNGGHEISGAKAYDWLENIFLQ